MELNINSPAYYSEKYGINDEIYCLCKMISEYVRDKRYSNAINIIGITPIIAPQDILQEGLWKELKKCEPRYGFASVSLRIDFEEYIEADVETKKGLIIQNILKSVKSISKRGSVDYISFESDVIRFCNEINLTI